MAAICVVEEEGDEIIELPLEEDGCLLLSTLQAQFGGTASGLRYRNPENGAIRGVRLIENKLHPFDPSLGWENHIYVCSFPKEAKRKNDGEVTESCTQPKTVKLGNSKVTTDLIVLGLPWKTTEDTLREYFETFGKLLVCQIKKDNSGKSKGYGFVRMGDYEAQQQILSKRHQIDGRWVDLKVPNSREPSQPQTPSKIFVGRITEDLTPDVIREYFSTFGDVTDIYIPKPFRSFAFVTFVDAEVAQSLCGEDHLINGCSVFISSPSPRQKQQPQQMNSNSNYDEERYGGNNNYMQQSSNNKYNNDGSNSYSQNRHANRNRYEQTDYDGRGGSQNYGRRDLDLMIPSMLSALSQWVQHPNSG